MKLGIICVDDEKIVIDSIKALFSENVNKDYFIEFAESGEEVFEITDEFEKEGIEIALILTDYIMPKMKGDELLVEIQKKYPYCKKVMLTGHADINGVEKVINNANLYRFITKPWNNEDLRLTVKEAVKSYTNEKEVREHTKILEKTVKEKTIELQNNLEILNNNVMFLKLDGKKRVLEISKAFSNFSYYEREKVKGMSYNEIIYKEELSDKIFEKLENTDVLKEEVQIINNFGKISWVESTYTKRIDKGQVFYNIIKHDISNKKKIENLIKIDPMTGLYNRRFFNEIFPVEINRAKREKNYISFIIIDVDHFKLYNDNYGHKMGDEVLIKIADVMKRISKRASDYPLRLGGEEFGIIFSGQSVEESFSYGELIKDEIEKMQIVHKNNGEIGVVTISVGVATIKTDRSLKMDEIYNVADNALYDAKSSGRNKVILGKFDI